MADMTLNSARASWQEHLSSEGEEREERLRIWREQALNLGQEITTIMKLLPPEIIVMMHEHVSTACMGPGATGLFDQIQAHINEMDANDTESLRKVHLRMGNLLGSVLVSALLLDIAAQKLEKDTPCGWGPSVQEIADRYGITEEDLGEYLEEGGDGET